MTLQEFIKLTIAGVVAEATEETNVHFDVSVVPSDDGNVSVDISGNQIASRVRFMIAIMPEKKQSPKIEVPIPHLSEFEFSTRVIRCLKDERYGQTSIRSTEQLLEQSVDDLLNRKNLGQTAVNEITRKLGERGLRLRNAC